jgi:hypothetical protein
VPTPSDLKTPRRGAYHASKSIVKESEHLLKNIIVQILFTVRSILI